MWRQGLAFVPKSCLGRCSFGASSTQQRRTIAVPTSIPSSVKIPMTLIDVHLRDEQLPFAYFFEETLDSLQLEASLERVLTSFSVLGGRPNLQHGVIECHPGDSVSLSFGESQSSLRQWLVDAPPQQLRQYGTRQQLSPLFDNLHHGDGREDTLASIRVTYFTCGGTVLGVNLSHALADAASCFRFVECWGREMKGLAYSKTSNKRCDATCSGMLSPELLDVLNLGDTPQKIEPSLLGTLLRRWGVEWGSKDEEDDCEPSLGLDCDETKTNTHEYVCLKFPPAVLQAMKAHGTEYCVGTDSEYVSTNDLVTAFGWLLKRDLSEQFDWDMSMVVNLRGRCGVDEFSNIANMNGVDGVFGNGITNVLASLTASSSQDECVHVTGMDDVGTAAVAIRRALITAVAEFPYRLAHSRMGKPTSAPASATSFASTSWQHFPVFDISFSTKGKLAAFRGQPCHPLPKGDTFSSMILPRKCGGLKLQLLTPSNKVERAKSFHRELSILYLEWYDNQTK